MKKIRLLSCLWLLTTALWAQVEEGAKISTASQAIQSENYTIQVGIPFLGLNNGTHTVNPIDVRHPWDVLYLHGTFSEESFDISKGYFGDKVLLNWTLRSNKEAVTNLVLSRRIYTEDNSESFQEISNISPTATTYEDLYIEGGVLYEYRLAAEGISDAIDERYTTFITGIGFRNPTAVVTGNISFEGGNPVKDVTIKATSEGSSFNIGSALNIPANGGLELLAMNNPITAATTLQAWVRPETAITSGTNSIDIFTLSNFDVNTIAVTASVDINNNKLSFDIDGAVYTIENMFPSGELNFRGDDEVDAIANFNTDFVHLSFVLSDGEVPLLYINGRPMTEAYAEAVNNNFQELDEDYAGPVMVVTVPTQTNTLSLSGNTTEWEDITVGGSTDALIDEIRIWNTVIDEAKIRTDYRRLISGNDSRLIAYLRGDENVGQYAYDLSRDGFEYNKNQGQLWDLFTPEANKVSWIDGSGNIPTSDQLGVLGVSDENGNYEITGIPYSGTGESFNITPLYGQHKFEPAQQLVFLGEGAAVVNKIDFVDTSSFVFKGKVMYDTRDVFSSYVDLGVDGDGQKISVTDLIDEGYNYYQKISGKFNKGTYWYNDNGTTDDTDDDFIEEFATVFSEGVSVYIDGQIVLDENNLPVTTDTEGKFEINVPIGNHYITIKKDGHEFTYNGRFPAESGTYKEFFEDAQESVIFIDQTRVDVVGKVVGGAVETQKEIGFGQDGLFTTTVTNAEGTEESMTVSAKNNIGVANITLDYIPVGGVTKYTQFNFTTNEESGEYRVSLLPLDYEINQQNGLKITNNPTLSLLSANESVNFSENVPVTIPEFYHNEELIATGAPYHFEKSFVYRETPVLSVTSQTSDEEIGIGDEMISTEGFIHPVYTQLKPYSITLSSFERYINKDYGDSEGDWVEDIVPVVDGELIFTNNLAYAGSESIVTDTNDPSVTIYSFEAGLPTVFMPFTKTIDIKYRVNGIDYEAENYNKEGIILGGLDDGSKTFITQAPDVPDIILRDPPGSNSFASIEEGESISITTDRAFDYSTGVSQNVKLFGGVKFLTGGGLAGPVIDTQGTNNLDVGISTSLTSSDGKSLTKTYTFSQTISTSDDPEYVGAEGDLYIGQSTNYFYGRFNNVQASNTNPADDPDSSTNQNEVLALSNDPDNPVYISTQKAYSFVTEPTDTYFIYSQKYLIESLLPEYKDIIENFDTFTPPNADTEEGEPLTIEYYIEQLRSWRSVIRENERSKYTALYERNKFKTKVETRIADFNTELNTLLENSELSSSQQELLTNKLAESKDIEGTVNDNFEDNISFDSGIGELTRNVETVVVNTTSRELNLVIEESVAAEIGFQLNTAGIISTTNIFFDQNINSSTEEEITKTTNISYTLKDDDPANVLSVDVINLFDGHGPIFATIGGVTSCPHEPAELSYFYDHETYRSDDDIIKLLVDGPDPINNPDDKIREDLSFATQKAEDPLISVEVASVSNVPESQNAEFVLKLENTSDFTSDGASFNYFELLIDNTTNPDNAIINIHQNATIVYVPYGEPVYYTMTLAKSVSDVYDYENIRVVLQSRCDPVNIYDDVYVSAHFTPSCSEVAVNAPLDNWVYNRDAAYNNDGTTNPMNIELAGFSTTFNSFKKIDLEYRPATSPTWTRLHTYYTTEDFYDTAILAGESEISLIAAATLSYSWDIATAQLPDGEYEIRARSSCTNDTEFISEIISGRVDLNAPKRFGTPLPTDGILSSGEDLKVSFNEAISYNSAVSKIEIKGATNQLPVDNNVSLYFEGTNNTAVIGNPRITTGDLTLEFWMNNATVASSATILQQTDGMEIALNNGLLSFTLGGVTATGAIADDGLFHHYTFTHKNSTGEIAIYEEDREVGGATGNANLSFSNNNDLIIGGNTFVGNIHSLRLWNKSITLVDAYAARFDQLVGNESNLIGYWPMNEGRGEIAKDLARFKHAQIDADWDIKPKGNSYEFANGQYLELDNVGFVQLTDEMDATISFWIKTGTAQNATIFSNGKGDGTDIVQSNGHANKWAINIDTDGMLSLASEGTDYLLTSSSVADNNWHHVTLLFNRIGSLRTYVDAALVSSNEIANIGGLSGNKIWLGARGSKDLSNTETVDRTFIGTIDEFRLWNTLRNVEQITRDQFNEVDAESIGLMLYARMNAPETASADGPIYFHAYSNQTTIASRAVLSSGAVNYADDVPAIKGERNLISFEVNRVINNDEMIIEPVVTDWAVLEGQILDITVHRMFDEANNTQESPITWTAYVKRNEVSWYADGYDDIVDIVKGDGEEASFDIVLVNRGGNGQPYNISNIPSWLSLSSTSGTLEPDSSKTITATIDTGLTAGEYLENLYLETDFGYDEKLQIEVRSLATSPDWEVNPDEYAYSMNIVGKIKVDGILSADPYDQIAAFVGDEIRGVAHLEYEEAFQEYFAFITVYSNTTANEAVEFSIWDASQGLMLQASVDGSTNVSFSQNAVLGSIGNAKIFENTGLVSQQLDFNQGWTWISLNVNDTNFSDIDQLTSDLALHSDDRILSHAPAQLEVFTENSGWSGSVSANGGVSPTKMYKVQLSNAQSLQMKGTKIDLANWDFDIKTNWNWLPYPLTANQQVNEALANFEANDGDVIKSQNLFAIYDKRTGWKGTLDYLEVGKGYMILSSKDQSLTYPAYLSKAAKRGVQSQSGITKEFAKYSQNMNAVVSLPEGYDKLYVYDAQGTLKGATQNLETGQTELSFITIYGDTPDRLKFYLGDEYGEIATGYTFEFKSNEVLGTIANPVIIKLQDELLSIEPTLTIYPNPFDDALVLQATSPKGGTTTIRLFSLTNQLLYSEKRELSAGTNVIRMLPKVATGTYLLQFETESETVTKRVIKK